MKCGEVKWPGYEGWRCGLISRVAILSHGTVISGARGVFSITELKYIKLLKCGAVTSNGGNGDRLFGSVF